MRGRQNEIAQLAAFQDRLLWCLGQAAEGGKRRRVHRVVVACGSARPGVFDRRPRFTRRPRRLELPQCSGPSRLAAERPPKA